MAKFHRLTIKNIQRQTADCVAITLEIPADLKEEFNYKPGQYVTLKLDLNGREFRRSYSLCSSPHTDSDFTIAVKAVENGNASVYLNNGIQVGQTLDVMRPMGNFFTDMLPGQQKNYVAFAAGSGITPIMSLIKSAMHVESQSHFTLFYSNKEADGVIFKKELQELSQQFSNRLTIYYIYTQQPAEEPLFTGRISGEKIRRIINEFPQVTKADDVFICGPFAMIQSISETLQSVGYEKERIHFELFTNDPPADSDVEHPAAAPASDGTTIVDTAKVIVVLDGEETEITMDGEETILDAILDNGLDAPYACTGGSCCTCRAKLIEGKAVMDVNYALSDKEVAQGYILTCQSHPTTPTVKVDYDIP